MDGARRNTLLEMPVKSGLLRLAWPVLAVLALQTLVGIAETYFVSSLGTDAVAGVALVFPVFMLMVMMSNGGIGGGVASAVARASGAGRRADAEALALHAVVLGSALGACFSLAVWLGGPALFELMGGRDMALANALTYANLVFAAAIPSWVANLLGAALRGAGNVRTPAVVTAVASLFALAASPALILGWGGLPALGIAGAAWAMNAMNIGMSIALIAIMMRPGAALRLRPGRLEARHFGDILRVGLPSAIGTVVANLAVVLTTGFVGRSGADAIAGYGLASRIDYLLIPLLFALGSASVTLVGTSVGAGNFRRAREVAWTGTAMSALALASIGGMAAVFPGAWLGLFTEEPAVLAAGTAYLQRVAPLYVMLGAGMAIYFASQGAGAMAWPFGAGLARLAVIGFGGALWAGRFDGSIEGLFWIVAASYAAFGGLNLYALASHRGWADRVSTVKGEVHVNRARAPRPRSA